MDRIDPDDAMLRNEPSERAGPSLVAAM
jgi:hypothetical protein